MVHYCLPSNCSGTTNSLSSSKRKESLRLRELKTFSHSLSESHTGNLISLSTTRGLPVVCSLATDFFVKLWNLECMLLREVTLGLNLSGACILLNPCILALSWRSHLLVIDDILSQESVSRLASANSRSDQVMASRPGLSVSFDPSLQFWYDSTKNKHNRINPRSGSGGLFSPQHSKHTVADSAGTRQFKHTVPGVLLEENAIAEKHPSPKPTFSGGTGNLTCNVRRNNGVDSTELDASQKKLQESLKEDREDRRSPLRSAVKNSFIKQISQGLSSPSRTLDSSYETLTAQGEGYRSAETSRFFSNLDRLGKVPPFHIPESVVLKAPRFPSQDLPVAPDGFIPNSIIRARFHLRKKSDGLLRASPLPTTVGLTFNLSSFLNPRNKRRSSSFELSSLSFESTIEPADKMSEDADVSSDTNATSQFLKDFCELEWKKRNKRPSKIKPSSLEPIDLNLLTRPRLQVDLEEIDLNLSMSYLQKKSRNKNTKRKLRSHPPMLDSDSYDSDFPHSCSPTPDLSRKRASGSLSAASSGDPHPTSSHNCRSALSGKMSPQSSHSYRRLSSNLIGGRTFSGKDLSLICSRSKVQSITKMLSSTGVSSNTQVQSSCQDQSSSQVQSSAIMQSSAKMESSAKMQSSDSLNLLDNDVHHGFGILVLSDGTYCETKFSQGDIEDGEEGYILSVIGHSFRGKIGPGLKLCGRGTLSFCSGSKLLSYTRGSFSGEWGKSVAVKSGEVHGLFPQAQPGAQQLRARPDSLLSSVDNQIGFCSVKASEKWIPLVEVYKQKMGFTPTGRRERRESGPRKDAYRLVESLPASSSTSASDHDDMTSSHHVQMGTPANIKRSLFDNDDPLCHMMNKLAAVFHESYSGLGTTKVLLPHAINETKEMIRHMHALIRCLYPHLHGDHHLLGPHGTRHSGREDRNNDWVDIDSGYSTIQPFVFERIFPTLFSLYVLHNEDQDSKYRRGVLILNRLGDAQLAMNLSMPQDLVDQLRDGRQDNPLMQLLTECAKSLEVIKAIFTPIEILRQFQDVFSKIATFSKAGSGMDTMLPLAIMAVVRAKFPRLGAYVHFLFDFVTEQSRVPNNQDGYIMTTFESIYSHITIEAERWPSDDI